MHRLPELETSLGELFGTPRTSRVSVYRRYKQVDVCVRIPGLPDDPDEAYEYVAKLLRNRVSRAAEWGSLHGPEGDPPKWYMDGWTSRSTYLVTISVDCGLKRPVVEV